MTKIRVYVDTSVFGGVYDEEFAEFSRRFFTEAREGCYLLLISQTTLDELVDAPQKVRDVLETMPTGSVLEIRPDTEINALADSYVAGGVLGEGMRNDALHVAAATVARADVILSWNFKHIVNFRRIHLFNGINSMNGYPRIEIYSPREMMDDDSDQDI